MCGRPATGSSWRRRNQSTHDRRGLRATLRLTFYSLLGSGPYRGAARLADDDRARQPRRPLSVSTCSARLPTRAASPPGRALARSPVGHVSSAPPESRVEDWRADGRGRWQFQPLSRWSAVRLPWSRFQPPPHQTQHADFPHYAFLPASRQGLCALHVYPSSQVPQSDRRLYHLASASHVAKVVTDSRAASLHRRYPASPVLPTPPPPSRLSADFPVLPVIRPTLLRRFLNGARRASPVA